MQASYCVVLESENQEELKVLVPFGPDVPCQETPLLRLGNEGKYVRGFFVKWSEGYEALRTKVQSFVGDPKAPIVINILDGVVAFLPFEQRIDPEKRRQFEQWKLDFKSSIPSSTFDEWCFFLTKLSQMVPRLALYGQVFFRPHPLLNATALTLYDLIQSGSQGSMDLLLIIVFGSSAVRGWQEFLKTDLILRAKDSEVKAQMAILQELNNEMLRDPTKRTPENQSVLFNIILNVGIALASLLQEMDSKVQTVSSQELLSYFGVVSGTLLLYLGSVVNMSPNWRKALKAWGGVQTVASASAGIALHLKKRQLREQQKLLTITLERLERTSRDQNQPTLLRTDAWYRESLGGIIKIYNQETLQF